MNTNKNNDKMPETKTSSAVNPFRQDDDEELQGSEQQQQQQPNNPTEGRKTGPNNNNDDDKHDTTIRDDDGEEEQSHGGFSFGIGGGRHIHFSENQLPYVVMFLAGLILLLAFLIGSSSPRVENYTYGIIVASVAMFLGCTGIVYHYMQHDNYNNNNNNSSAMMIGSVLAYFSFVWCFTGACILTFRGPFEITGNGYFASWGIAVAGAMAVGVSGSKIQSALTGFSGSLLGLLAAAIVVILAIVDEFGGQHNGESIYTIIVACLTVIVVGFFAYQQYYAQGGGVSDYSRIAFGVLAAFAILWIVLAGTVTFRGPFTLTGNGYFGAWAGAIVSVYAAKAAHQL